MRILKATLLNIFLALLTVSQLLAQNPLIRDQFSADPTARVFGDKVYIFPSHDILATEEFGRKGWFCMADYHVFSSEDLINWTDHGVIVSQEKVEWVNPTSYSMWAPDCISKNGKYYFYFPTAAKDTTYGRGFSIGVAVAEKPEGPYKPEITPIKNVKGIDPNVFIDKDGQAYLYWSLRNFMGAKLKDNMLELDSEPVILGEFPTKGLKEGPFLFERNGIYYMTYPHVENNTERLEYAIGDNPMGPFTYAGVIMDELPSGCWTNHQSIIEFKDQWFLFYHNNDLSPDFDKNRSVRADSLFFNEDGTIKKVTPTHRGIGLTKATKQIHPDRYSKISTLGTAIAFMNTASRYNGWKTILIGKDAWIQYDGVDFSDVTAKSVMVKAQSLTGGTLVIKSGAKDGEVIAEVAVPKGTWEIQKASLLPLEKEISGIYLELKEDAAIEVDWLQFE